jgi:hypothetical protein
VADQLGSREIRLFYTTHGSLLKKHFEKEKVYVSQAVDVGVANVPVLQYINGDDLNKLKSNF